MVFKLRANLENWQHLYPFRVDENRILLPRQAHRLFGNVRGFVVGSDQWNPFVIDPCSMLFRNPLGARVAFLRGNQAGTEIEVLPMRSDLGHSLAFSGQYLRADSWSSVQPGSAIAVVSDRGADLFTFILDFIDPDVSIIGNPYYVNPNESAGYNEIGTGGGIGDYTSVVAQSLGIAGHDHYGTMGSHDLVGRMCEGVVLKEVHRSGRTQFHRINRSEPTGNIGILLGRGSEENGNHVKILDEAVSRAHAVLILGIHMVLEDLGSCNGTFINGERISSRVLHFGDMITLGGTKLFVMREKEATSQEDVHDLNTVTVGEIMSKLV